MQETTRQDPERTLRVFSFAGVLVVGIKPFVGNINCPNLGLDFGFDMTILYGCLMEGNFLKFFDIKPRQVQSKPAEPHRCRVCHLNEPRIKRID